jgi:hypothetical protein
MVLRFLVELFLMATVLLVRVAALLTGAAAAGIAGYASFEAARTANGGYLMIAGPVVAIAAALVPVFFEHAVKAKLHLRAFALFLVFLPVAASVFYIAAERVHFAKATGDAEHASYRASVERAETALVEAKTAAAAATRAADKVRGTPDKKCRTACLSVKASETAALGRVAVAEQALAAAQAAAITDAPMRAPVWLQPAALDMVGVVLLAVGFGLSAAPTKALVPVDPQPEAVEEQAPAEKPLTKRQAAAKKAWATRRKRTSLQAKGRKLKAV